MPAASSAVDRRIAQVVATFDDDVAIGVDRVGGQRAGVRGGLHARVPDDPPSGCALAERDVDAARRAAVGLRG